MPIVAPNHATLSSKSPLHFAEFHGWRTFVQVQKQDSAFKNVVVEVTEDAILNAVGSWVAMMKTNDKTEVNSSNKTNDDGDDDVSSNLLHFSHVPLLNLLA